MNNQTKKKKSNYFSLQGGRGVTAYHYETILIRQVHPKEIFFQFAKKKLLILSIIFLRLN